MKKLVLFLLVVGAVAGGYYYYHEYLSSSFLTQKTVTISGKEYDVRPKKYLAKCGLKVRRVPDRQNAAILYCKASNVYVEPDRVRLQPANSQMKPLYASPENVEIQGRVIAVIRQVG